MKITILFSQLFLAINFLASGQVNNCTDEILNGKQETTLGSIENYQENIKKYKNAFAKLEAYRKTADSLKTIVSNSSLSKDEKEIFNQLISLTVNDTANDVSAKARTLDSKYILPFNSLIPLTSLYDLDKKVNLENTAITDCKKWAAEVCKFATNKDINYYNAEKVKEDDAVFEAEIKHYNLNKGDVIADIGAGSAYIERAFSKYTDNITVYVNEINADMVAKLQTKLALLDFYDNKTITYLAVLGDIKSANLPKGKFDKIIIRNTFHHFAYPNEMMQDLKASLKKEGKLYIIDIMKEDVVKTPACPNHITKATQLKYMTDNGFTLIRTIPLNYDEFQLLEFDYK